MAEKLEDLKGVGSVTVERLNNAGVENLNDLAQADPENLQKEGMSERKSRRLVTRAKEEAIVIKTGDDIVQKYEEKEFISTGIEGMDNILGGGWEPGFVACVAGGSGGGKTQISFQALVSAVEETEKPGIYIETEPGRYRPERIKSLANKEDTQSKIHMVEAYDLDSQLKAISKIKNSYTEGDLSMVVVDSFTARFRLSDQFKNRGDLQSRSKEMGRHLTRLERLADKLEIPVIITAQVYGNPGGYGAAEAMYGGSLMQHTIGCLIHMKKAQGSLRKAQLRNHPGREDDECHVSINKDEIKSVETN